ncbi:HD domain-containing protein [Mucilaginibacter ginsenosidivorax]|uniref:HD domain-containing protein n=1 Tax=Mucilaginibacter ginsenosidivorax TaxID=862126 RepID=A0A5B8W5K7_9SPHI|nr:HD domain-containing protein [Mucilaginibacter ginsenosidivorax]QEC78869.1 hypothetical protein FSB76_24035 [Mucilaginibacter ginsenosidivorax]
MKRSKVGTYEWSLSTDTSLNLKESIALFGQLVAAQLFDALNAAGNKLGLNRNKMARVDASKIIIPDSKIAKETFEYASELYDLPLLNHCIRTYLWGVLLGQYDNVHPDLEFLYVSGLLHDIGLSKVHEHKIGSCCFAITGAGQAKAFVEQKGWMPERSIALFNAIGMHLNPMVSKTDGLEGFLLKSGAFMDLLGGGHTKIPLSEKTKIIHEYPRLKFNEDILDVKHLPNSRGAFFAKFGAEKLSKKNPLNQLEHVDLSNK